MQIPAFLSRAGAALNPAWTVVKAHPLTTIWATGNGVRFGVAAVSSDTIKAENGEPMIEAVLFGVVAYLFDSAASMVAGTAIKYLWAQGISLLQLGWGQLKSNPLSTLIGVGLVVRLGQCAKGQEQKFRPID